MFDPNASVVKQSLAETILWCSRLILTATAEESDEMLRRHALIEEAGRLRQRAQSKRSWFRRDVYKSRDWQRGMKLLKEGAPDSLAPLEKQLRCSSLEPNLPLDKAGSEEEREVIVAGVIRLRSQLLAGQMPPFSEDQSGAEKIGRFLNYFLTENVADGASRYASNGFFDPHDAPPWDTWLHYSDRTLVSWVPAVLVPLAQDGIDANAVDCIDWVQLTP